MSYFVFAGFWFDSFHALPGFIIGIKSICLFIHKTINNMKITIITSLLLLITVVSCNTTDPTPPDETKPVLTLSFDKKSCTELWIKLTTKDLELPAELTLKQYNPNGDSLSQDFVLSIKDTLLYIDSLLPSQSYKFKVVANTTNHPQPTTNEVELTTLDTTSHNFTYQTFEFGEPLTGNSSRL